MDSNIDLKEFWQSWLIMEQTKLLVEKLEGIKQDLLESTLNAPSDKRSDLVSIAMGVRASIDLINNLKEDS